MSTNVEPEARKETATEMYDRWRAMPMFCGSRVASTEWANLAMYEKHAWALFASETP